MGPYLDQIAASGFDRVIGTSGTILSLGALALSDGAAPPDDLRNRRVSAKALHKVRKRLVEADIEARLHMPGLDPRRADLSVAGSVLLDTILRRLGAEDFTLCDLALREGLVLDYIQRNSARIRKVERYPDVRRRSVVELGERCGYWSEHAQQVARLAVSIFDQTRSVARPQRPRTGVARVRRAAARRRRAHQLRAASPAFVLPDQEWRPARLRSAGDRGHRADRAVPSPGHAEEVARGLRRSAPERCGAPCASCRRWSGSPRGSTAATRRRSRASTCSRGATTIWRGCAPPATPSSSSGPRTGTSRPLERELGRPIRFEVAGTDYKEQPPHAEQPDHAATSTPESCSWSRASTGPERRRSSRLLAKWLSAAGHPVFVTEWNSSALVKAATKTGQEEELADADDVQPAARDRLRGPAAVQHHPAAQGGHDRARRPLRVHGVRARRRPRRRSAVGARALQLRGAARPGGVLPRADRGVDSTGCSRAA